jgi:hypothetical protein
MKHLLACTLALVAAWPALAQDDSAERARIQAERGAAESRFAEAQKSCRAKFAVNDCLDKATRAHNAVLSELRRQERVLNDADRKRRAAERQKEVDERQSPERQQDAAEKRARALAEQKEREERAADKAAKRASDEAERAQRPPRSKLAASAPGPQGAPRTPTAPRSHGPSAEEAAKNRATYEARQQEAVQHKAEVAARIARRAKPAASDLPAPK